MPKSNASRKQKILVVEDEPAISHLCQRILTEEGFAVDIANNGIIAQGMVAKKQYDLCLIDIRTPAMNGKELYQWLKEKHPALTNKVVFTTGSRLGEDTENFLRQFARPFLIKPFTPDQLRAVISKALDRA